MAPVMATDTSYIPGLWLTGAEWLSGNALQWWLQGWTRNGLVNTPMVSKRDETGPDAGILVQASRSRFQAVHAEEGLSSG